MQNLLDTLTVIASVIVLVILAWLLILGGLWMLLWSYGAELRLPY